MLDDHVKKLAVEVYAEVRDKLRPLEMSPRDCKRLGELAQGVLTSQHILGKVLENLRWIRATEADVVLLSELSRIEYEDLEKERDYAVKEWLRLENKHERSRHKPDEPWTRDELFAEMRTNIANDEECNDE